MGYLVLAFIVVFLLAVLWGPPLFIFLRSKRWGFSAHIKPIAALLSLQVVLVIALVMFEDLIGLTNPGGYTLATTVLVGGFGGIVAWIWPSHAGRSLEIDAPKDHAL